MSVIRYHLKRYTRNLIASNETVLMLVQESTNSYIYTTASSAVMKQHFQLVQLHLKPSNYLICNEYMTINLHCYNYEIHNSKSVVAFRKCQR